MGAGDTISFTAHGNIRRMKTGGIYVLELCGL